MQAKVPAAAPILEVDGLSVRYGKVEALHGAAIRVAPGQIVSVIGPNGAGKSTLLSAIMGKPDLLMLDEPSLGLAPLIVREIFHIISALRGTGVATLLIEQNARAALQISDYAYVLETGEFVLDGPAAELAQNPRVIDSYLGLSRK
ncbi:ATP-binding cassette domain-containing protein, partial [Burkholderia ambifaria]|uniref:ATP-binding cassette domain-containing protein n=1 Tax=Burkholderia ambifaria TaxID=152480 RepID=UPI001ABBE0ED